MTAVGTKRPIAGEPSKSALKGEADEALQRAEQPLLTQSGHCAPHSRRSFDHFICPGEQRGWDAETECLSGLEVDD
jgi:hypothetical protein